MSKHNLQERLFCNYHTKQVVRWDIVKRPGSVKLSPGMVSQVTESGHSRFPQPARERLTNVIVKILPNPHLTNEAKKYLVNRNINVQSLRHMSAMQITIDAIRMNVCFWLLNESHVIVYARRLDLPTRNEVWKSFVYKRLQSDSIDHPRSFGPIIRSLLNVSSSENRFVWKVIHPEKGMILWENSQ